MTDSTPAQGRNNEGDGVQVRDFQHTVPTMQQQHKGVSHMAETEKQNMAGTVKTQDAIKAELLARLNATADVVADLAEQLGTIESNLDPAPAPYPDAISPSEFYESRLLLKEKARMAEAMDGLLTTAQVVANSAIQHTLSVPPYCRNRSAWADTLKKCEGHMRIQADALRKSADAFYDYVAHMARLATFAACDVVPEAEQVEGGAA